MGSGVSTQGSQSSYQQMNGKENNIETAIKQGEDLSDFTFSELVKCKLEQPPINPSTKRKTEIFNSADYLDFDNQIKQLIPSLLKLPTHEFINKLMEGFENDDLKKVRALFFLLATLKLNSLPEDVEPEINSPLEYFHKIKHNKANHAHAFCALCKAAQVSCYIVGGMNKSAAYSLGKDVSSEKMAAQWNSVYVCGEWRLVDCYWSSTCVVGGEDDEDWTVLDIDGRIVTGKQIAGSGRQKDRINESFFLTDPEQLVFTHLPKNQIWQLLDKERVFTELDFQQSVYRRERSFELGVEFNETDMKRCLIKTDNNQVEIRLDLTDNSPSINFKYLLFMTKEDEDSRGSLEKFVLFERTTGSITYKASIPIKTILKMDIYGKDNRKHKSFDLVCSYLIDCKAPSGNAEKLPDDPAIGYGTDNGHLEAYGIKPLEHTDATITADSGEVDIPFKLETPSLEIEKQILSNTKTSDQLQSYSYVLMNGDDMSFHIRVPEAGVYAGELFAAEPLPDAKLQNVVNYLIKCQNSSASHKPYPHIMNGRLGSLTMMKDLGIEVIDPKHPIITTSDGQVKIKLRVPEGITLCGYTDTTKLADDKLSNQIKMSQNGDIVEFNLNLLMKGENSFNIFAAADDQSRIYNVFNYLIDNQSDSKEKSTDRNLAGIEKIVVMSNIAEITLTHVNPDDIRAKLCSKETVQTQMRSQITVKKLDDPKVLVRVVLPEAGIYNLELFEDKEGRAALKKRYEIDCKGIIKETEPEPIKEEPEIDPNAEMITELETAKRDRYAQLREKLYNLILKETPAGLQSFLNELAAEETKDDPLNLKGTAENELIYLRAKKDLTEALSSDDDVNKLKISINNAATCKHKGRLTEMLSYANQYLEKLERLKILRHAILNLDQRTIAEIKSFSTPPDGIRQVMTASLILLGNTKKEMKTWPQVQVLIGKTGKESLKRRVTQFNVKKLSKEVAATATAILEKFTINEISAVSAGAATFYKWSSGMIAEIDD